MGDKDLAESGAFFTELDRLDQQQVIMEATGAVVQELVYEVRGKKGISYAGINHICFFMGDIKTELWVSWEKIEMNKEEWWSATVRAVNESYNLAALGTAEAPEFMDVYDRDERGEKVPDGMGGSKMHKEFDHFCRRKALGMAQRNAKSAVIPKAVLAQWLGYFLDLKAGKKVEPPFKPKVVDAQFRTLPEALKAPASMAEFEYNFSQLPFFDVLKFSEKDGTYVIRKTRILKEEEFGKVMEIVRRFGGGWFREENSWVIPLKDKASA